MDKEERLWGRRLILLFDYSELCAFPMWKTDGVLGPWMMRIPVLRKTMFFGLHLSERVLPPA